mgnify:CR=1 FL=1
MKFLISGSRNYSNYALINAVIKGILETVKQPKFCHGGAKGADQLADDSLMLHLGMNYSEQVTVYKADWNKYGKLAGPIRNDKMLLEFDPDVVLCFKDGFDRDMKYGGTEHMARSAKFAGKKVFLIERL